jgi:hypothetical protein
MTIAMQPIYTQTVGAGGAASITFNNIPQYFTDLMVKTSVRTNNTGVRVRFNADSSANYSWRRLSGNSSAAFSDSNVTYGAPYNSFAYFSMHSTTSDTANTFGNGEIYIPNYTSANQKSLILDSVQETNAATSNLAMQAGLWSGTVAITSITFSPDTGTSPNFAQHSTFTLYGITKG